MNPTADQQPPAQPPRSSFSCGRHPDENFSGFCPSCLCERLTTLDQSAAAASSSRRNSTSSASAAIKSLFRVPASATSAAVEEGNRNKITARASFLPELRRTKSFSATKADGLGFSGGVHEPQRRSCDVRGRSTLWTLFSIDDENRPRHSFSAQQQALGTTGAGVLETNREDDEEEKEDQFHDGGDEIRVCEEPGARNSNDPENQNGIVELEPEIQPAKAVMAEESKMMKDHIDLDSHPKKPSLSNFWSAASVLSKKWQKWRRKRHNTAGNGRFPPEKPVSRRRHLETQSEIADYGFGRRSCDTDPRFSLDAGRFSFDDPRCSFDEPRPSWDGYMIGRTFPRLPPTVEHVPVVHIPRSDLQLPVEESPFSGDNVPGGSIQTREYYLDSSSKRRKSLDRSNSLRRTDETKANGGVSIAQVSPATIDYSHAHGGRDSNSLRDDCSETFELGVRDTHKKEAAKKPRRWGWKLWGFLQRGHRGNKDHGGDGFSRVNRVGRSWSESWQDPRGEASHRGFNPKTFRSNSSVSWRSSSYNTMKSSSMMHENGNAKNRKGGDEFVLERNRSARYSPSHNENGLLRSYLGGSRRGSRLAGNSHSIARSKS